MTRTPSPLPSRTPAAARLPRSARLLLLALTAALLPLSACGPLAATPNPDAPRNAAPVAGDDAYALDLERSATLAVAAPGVLGNDTDADGDALAAEPLEAPAHGTLQLNADGSFSYTPDAGFSGADAFRYRASDGAASAIATVSLTVVPPGDPGDPGGDPGDNAAPVAGDDAYTVPGDASLQIAAPGVLENDTDADGDDLAAVLADPPAHGTLALNADGSFSYTPDPGFTGADAFTYRATDGSGDGSGVSEPATVALTVTPPDPGDPGDPGGETLEWLANGASARTARTEGQGVLVGDRLYVFGGYVDTTFRPTTAAEAYHLDDNAWTALADLPRGVSHAGTTTDGNSIFLAGGYPEGGRSPQLFCSDEVWAYRIATDTWSAPGEIPDLPQPRGSGALVHLDGHLHFFGGADCQRADRNEHWVLDLAGGTWQTAAALPEARNHLGYAVLDGLIYAIGGQTGQDHTLVAKRDVFSYDPTTDTWTEHPMTPLPAPRSHIAGSTVSLAGRIFVIAGQSDHNQEVASVYAFDPDAGDAGAWSALADLKSPRFSGVAGGRGDTLVHATGGDGGGKPTATTYRGRLR